MKHSEPLPDFFDEFLPPLEESSIVAGRNGDGQVGAVARVKITSLRDEGKLLGGESINDDGRSGGVLPYHRGIGVFVKTGEQVGRLLEGYPAGTDGIEMKGGTVELFPLKNFLGTLLQECLQVRKERCCHSVMGLIVDFLKMATRDVGGGNGADAFDGDKEPVVVAHAANVAFGSLERSADDPDVLAPMELLTIVAEELQSFLTGGGYEFEALHLVVRDLCGNFPGLSKMGIENDAVGQQPLLLDDLLQSTLDEKQGGNDRLEFFLLLSVLDNHDRFGGEIRLDVALLQQFGNFKYLVEENLEGVPVFRG